MQALTVLAAAAAGALAGSLIPGTAARVPAGRPVLGRRLGPASPIPRRRTVTVVVATAVTCAALGAHLGPVAELPAFGFLAVLGVTLAVIDLDCRRLPDALTLPAYPIAAALLAPAVIADGEPTRAVRALGAGLALFAFYYLLALIYPAGMGFGDVKLAGVLGLYLGWVSWSAVALGTFIGFGASAAAGLVLLAARRVSLRSTLPFGPFMLLGGLLGILWGHAFAQWYLGGP